MSLRHLLLPAALLAVLAVGLAETAQAAPLGAGSSVRTGTTR